jgi:predicted Zn-dependent protease
MDGATSPMLERLREFLSKNPKDSFVRYGYAMELLKLGRTAEALASFQQLTQDDPDYVAAYQQAAMLLARDGRTPEAKEMFRKGIEAAARKGNQHAYGEMQGMLEQMTSDE